jgi:hypothetical protein
VLERAREAAVASPGSARRSNFSKLIAISSEAFLAGRQSLGSSVPPSAKRRFQGVFENEMIEKIDTGSYAPFVLVTS